MIVDCTVHAFAATPGHGHLSGYLRKRPNVLAPPPASGSASRSSAGRREGGGGDFEARLARTVNETPELDAAVVLAFDRVYAEDGTPDDAHTHLSVTNDYAAELSAPAPETALRRVRPVPAGRHRRTERCVAAGRG